MPGQEEHAGNLLIDPALRSKVRFAQANLTTALPRLGQFDVVFLRNVMIYFNQATKAQVIARVVACLKPGAYLCIGHSEHLGDVRTGLNALAPSVHQKAIRLGICSKVKRNAAAPSFRRRGPRDACKRDLRTAVEHGELGRIPRLFHQIASDRRVVAHGPGLIVAP